MQYPELRIEGIYCLQRGFGLDHGCRQNFLWMRRAVRNPGARRTPAATPERAAPTTTQNRTTAIESAICVGRFCGFACPGAVAAPSSGRPGLLAIFPEGSWRHNRPVQNFYAHPWAHLDLTTHTCLWYLYNCQWTKLGPMPWAMLQLRLENPISLALSNAANESGFFWCI